MVTFRALAVFLAFASPILVRADVTPSEPGPGSVYNAGSRCRVTWEGDPDSTTAWREMAIQLMSGSNLDMVHITTVTTEQDGTKDGTFEYTCPEVNPYSAIYFYQFTSPNAPVKSWTTRFTIASPTGATTPPANPRQPTGDPIPWGVGNLVDQSKAVPAPAFAGDGPSSSTASNSTVVASSTRMSSVIVTSTKLTSHVASSTPSPSNSTGSASTSTSDAPSSFFDGKLWITALVALVFTTAF